MFDENLSYYNLDLFRNVQYAVNINLTNYFANLLFNGDVARVIKSSTQYAFRKRAKNSEINLNTLDFPFLNFRINKITNFQSGDLTRKIWQHLQNIQGVYIPELGRKLRYTPMQIEYDCTFFCHRNDELQYAHSLLAWESSNEIIIEPSITIDNIEVPFHGYVNYNLDYEPEYNELSALEKNNIHSISINPNIITIMIRDNMPGSNYCIPKKVIMDFYAGYNENPGDTTESERYQFIINHFNEDVTPA